MGTQSHRNSLRKKSYNNLCTRLLYSQTIYCNLYNTLVAFLPQQPQNLPKLISFTNSSSARTKTSSTLSNFLEDFLALNLTGKITMQFEQTHKHSLWLFSSSSFFFPFLIQLKGEEGWIFSLNSFEFCNPQLNGKIVHNEFYIDVQTFV